MSFRLTHDPLEAETEFGGPGDGAVASFVGRVRNVHQGRRVTALEYEAYDELAASEGIAIVEEARARFAVSDVRCVHRLGRLEVGEAAIRIDVAAPHRRAGFAACRFVLDEVKKRVPIWKKEYFEGGESEWVNAAEGAAAARSDRYYSRQTVLPEVGLDGQKRLSDASVLVVGAGGLGCAALHYLAGAGVGKIGICDPDDLHESNLHRQTLYEHVDVGLPKAWLASSRIAALNPFIELVTHQEAIHADNVRERIKPYDLILDCTDNFETKFLLNDACVDLGKPLFLAAIYQHEGQVQRVVPGGPCLRCLWPEQPDEGCVGTCAEAGVLGYVAGLFGTIQAGEAIKHILGIASPLDGGSLFVVDLVSMTTQLMSLPKDPLCPACGQGIAAAATPPHDPVSLRPSQIAGCTLIDIRPPSEAAECPILDSLAINPAEVLAHPDRWRGDQRWVLVCSKGVRSRLLAEELRRRGLGNIFSLQGGSDALRRRG